MRVSTPREAHLTVTRQFIITEDEPVVPMTYSSPPKKVRIERGAIEYQWFDGGWHVRNEYAVSLTGTVLLKNGLPGKNLHTRPAESQPRSWSNPFLIVADGWQWLDEIIWLLRPTGIAPGMLVLDDHEVTNL